MFYTLVSKTLITNISSPKDYLYIFIIGSIGYIALHWYLHMDEKEGIFEKIKENLYYAMVVDMIVACVMVTMYPTKKNDKNKIDQDKPTENNSITNEKERFLLQRMQEARRLQQMKQKDFAKTQKKENSFDQHIDGKRSIFSKSDESKESKDSKDSTLEEQQQNIKQPAKKNVEQNVGQNVGQNVEQKISKNKKTSEKKNNEIMVKSKNNQKKINDDLEDIDDFDDLEDTEIPKYENNK